MGIRSRIKNKLGLGSAKREGAAPEKDHSRANFLPKTASDPRYEPDLPPRAAPPPAERVPQKPADNPPEKLDAADDDEAKYQRHATRARKAVLKMLDQQGGTATLKEMHDLSEKRYFIGHKKFSDMFEAMIAEGYIDFDSAGGVGTITANGRALARG